METYRTRLLPLCWLYGVILLSSCTFVRHEQEKAQFHFTKYVLQTSVPSKVLNECGYRLDMELPDIRAVDNFAFMEAISKVKYSNIEGVYFPERNIIFYKKGRVKALAHEIQHALNHNGVNGPISRDCLDEVTAYYLMKIGTLKAEIKRLKWENLK